MERIVATAVIADDEPLLSHHLNRSLAEYWPELEVVGVAQNGQHALELIEQLRPDIAFLDIKMPKLDGMSAAKLLNKSEHKVELVFVTAYDEYALQAFETNAVDYLLKPITDERLEKCVEKLKQRVQLHSETNKVGQSPDINALLSQIQQLGEQKTSQYLTWLRASKGEDIHLISVTDVLYFRAEDKYVSLFVSEKGKPVEYLLRTSLKELMQQLDPEQFWQIHRSTIVNVSAVEKVKRILTGKMVAVIGDEKLPISRAMQSKFTSLW